MKPVGPALAVSLLLAAAAPSASARPLPVRAPFDHLLELRGAATAERLSRHLDFPPFASFHPEESFIRGFFLERDTPLTFLAHSPGGSSVVMGIAPEDRRDFFACHLWAGWERLPDTPEGFQAWTPPNRAFTNYYAETAGRLVGSESADHLRADFESLATLPATLPAEGAVVEQYTGHALNIAAACAAESDLGTAIPENVATFTVGIDTDPDRDGVGVVIRAVIAPVPGSELDAWIRALPDAPIPRVPPTLPNAPIPPEAYCVGVPGTLAFAAVASLPPLPSFLRDTLPPRLAGYLANRVVSFSLLPPARHDGTATALFYATSPDPARTFRTLDACCGGLATNRVHSPTVLFAPASRRPPPCPAPRDFVRGLLANGATWRFAPLPGALLAADNASDFSIDFALDRLLDDELATRPPLAYPVSPPVVTLHADLRALLDAYPAIGRVLCPFLAKPLRTGRAPLSLDASLRARNGILELRIYAPNPANTPVNLLSMAAMWTWKLREGTPLSGGDTPSRKPGTTLPLLGPAPQGMPSGGQAVPIAPAPFLGWPEAFALTNSRLHAVVVPAIGRLAFLSFAPDAPNLLRLDPDSPDIGGDWTWPVAQTRWPAMAPFGTDWPPPAALADAPCDASAWREPDGSQHVRLVRRYPAPVCATLTREFIVFPHDSPVLRCEQTLSYGPGPIEEIPVPLTLWHVTQVANPFRLGCAIPSADVSPDVLLGVLDPAAHHVNSFKTSNPSHTFIYEPPAGAREVKLAFPPSPVPLVAGKTVSVAAHNDNANIFVSTRGPGHHGELYSNPALGYGQLETLSPEISWPLRDRDAPALSNTLVYWIGPTEKTHHYLKGSQP